MSNILWDTGWRPTVVDWGSTMSSCCTASPTVCKRVQWQWMTTQCAAISLAHAKQLTLPRLQSTSGHKL